MTKSRVGVVLNPAKIEQSELAVALDKVIARLERTTDLEFEITWAQTSSEGPEHGPTQSLLDAGVDLVIAAGGDGTVQTTAQYLGETRAAVDLGIVPVGTGNLLARNLGIPLRGVRAAFERALTADGRPLDLGWVEFDGPKGPERHAFTVMCGFGIDANMIIETDDDLKEQAGWFAYVESLGRAISASESVPMRLNADGREIDNDNAHTVLFGNCGMLPGGLTLMADAQHDDGELDVLVLETEGIMDWVGTLGQIAWRNGLGRLFSAPEPQSRSGSAQWLRGSTFEVTLAEPRRVEIDGDDLAELTHFRVVNQHHAIRVRH